MVSSYEYEDTNIKTVVKARVKHMPHIRVLSSVLLSTFDLSPKDSQIRSISRLGQILCNIGTRREVKVFY